MDAEDQKVVRGASDEFDVDVIDAVAQVNSYLPDDRTSTCTSFLPELRASPCHIHHPSHQKHHLTLHQQQHLQRADDRNDLLYSTSCHGGHKSTTSAASRLSPTSSILDESKLQVERDIAFQRNMQAGKSQTYKRPMLPKESINPEDFVSTWLQYGSELQGNHFPNIIPGKPNLSGCSVLCKLGRKQTLSPIQTQRKTSRKLSSKTSALSEL